MPCVTGMVLLSSVSLDKFKGLKHKQAEGLVQRDGDVGLPVPTAVSVPQFTVGEPHLAGSQSFLGAKQRALPSLRAAVRFWGPRGGRKVPSPLRRDP